MRIHRPVVVLAAALLVGACAQPPPTTPNDVCQIFEDRKGWLKAARSAEKRWNIPASVAMAFIHQESSFINDARPPSKKTKILWFIPYEVPVTTAYGYSQALDGTWDDYKKDTDRTFARRTNFKDSIDFIGWYNDKSARSLGIRRTDAYRLYLAYHEGRTGYRRGSYRQKPDLIKIARRVDKRRKLYAKQLKACARKLGNPWYIPNFYL